MTGQRQSALSSGLSYRALLRAVGFVRTEDLSRTESASTLFRFFRSKHVRDLKLICAAALSVLVIHLVLVFLFGVVNWGTPSGEKTILLLNQSVSQLAQPPLRGRDAAAAFFSFVIQYIGPAVPIYGIIMGWAYQSASKRLGIIDLFACEISTLCRVGTMFDISKHYISNCDAPPSVATPQWAGSGRFVSEEKYFPVFDNNSRDLQLLEAAVVENITQFYTYMKAFRDVRRKLDIGPPQGEPGAAGGNAQTRQDASSMDTRDARTEYQRGVIASIIYLLYVAYESARQAVNDLVEFQPDAAERAMVIFLTELPCYAFLLRYYEKEKDDVRYKRLKLREATYRKEVPKLYIHVKDAAIGKNKEEWLPAHEMIPELATRYKETFGEDMGAAVGRVSKEWSEDATGAARLVSSTRRALPQRTQAT